jgi:hypothetical protein
VWCGVGWCCVVEARGRRRDSVGGLASFMAVIFESCAPSGLVAVNPFWVYMYRQFVQSRREGEQPWRTAGLL